MAASLDSLVESWKRQPDERNTIALCEELGATDKVPLIDEVGKRAAIKFASNPTVLMAVARMYLAANRLGDAQGLLVSAGKMVPKNAEVYRWLGEVLLRRGDAERAAKVLERAVVLGRIDSETLFWRNQADGYVELQRKSGAQAVVFALSDVLVSMGLPPPKPGNRSTPRPAPPRSPPPPRVETMSEAELTLVKPVPLAPPQPAPPPPATSRPPQPQPQPPSSPFAPVGKAASTARPISVPPPAPPKPPSRVPAPPLPNLASQTTAHSLSPAISAGPPLPSFANDEPITTRKGDGRTGLFAPSKTASPLAEARLSLRPSTQLQPRDVLNALALTGVFEPAGAATATWDAPPKTRSRYLVTLGVLTVLLVGAGAGVFKYVGDVRSKQAEVARGLDAEVSRQLDSGKVGDLAGTEAKLSRAFDLEPNNPTSALLWVKNRVLRAVESEGESEGIDTAMARARQVGVGEPALAFARIGSFVAQGDTAGAAALLPQWDEPAKKEPYFQLLAGIALERAGDLRAIERYELATKLDPELVPAQLLLARAVVLEGDRNRGLELSKAFRNKWPDRAEGAALIALNWARDPARGPAPPEAEQAKNRRDELPVALRPVSSAVEALLARDHHLEAEAKAALGRGIDQSASPGIATWLGTLALDMGDEALARRAALQAVRFSAIYPQARVLAARVALSGGRLDEAIHAVSELDASLPDVAVIRATVAYEKLDPDGVGLAVEALSPEARQRPELAALTQALSVMRGTANLDANKLRSLASPEIAWGDIIALDAALDAGNLPVAKELIDRFGDSKGMPPRALRVARYLRYTDHAADADPLSKAALELLSPRSVVERVLLLLALKKDDEAHALVAKNAPLLGPMASWIVAYIDAGGPHVAEARAKEALLDPPGPSTPLLWRVVTVLAMGDLGDRKRGVDLLRSVSRTFPKNADVIVAAEAFRH